MVKLAAYAVILVIVVIVVILQQIFGKKAKAKRALKNAQQVPIGQIQNNMLVKLVGQVHLPNPQQALVAPLSERPCAHYQLTVEQKAGKGGWTAIITDIQSQEFWIRDQSGWALVRPMGAQILLEMDKRRRSGTGKDATPKLEALLNAHGKKSKGWVFNKELRYQEGVLEQDETVAVLGLATIEPDGQGGQRIAVGPPLQGQLVITDQTELV